MKKLVLYLSIVIALFALLFIIDQQSQKKTNEAVAEEAQQLYNTTPDKLNPATVKQLNDPNYQFVILPDELKQRINNNEDLFVYFFSPTCSYCVATTPHLVTIAEEVGVEIHQFNKLEFDSIAVNQYGVTETPTLVYFSNGQAADAIVGGFSGNADNDAIAQSAYTDFLTRNKAN